MPEPNGFCKEGHERDALRGRVHKAKSCHSAQIRHKPWNRLRDLQDRRARGRKIKGVIGSKIGRWKTQSLPPALLRYTVMQFEKAMSSDRSRNEFHPSANSLNNTNIAQPHLFLFHSATTFINHHTITSRAAKDSQDGKPKLVQAP